MGEDHLSPDGRYVVQLACNEYRMSHWVCTPTLKEVVSGKMIWDLYPTPWSADIVTWSPDSRTVHMGLRLYPGSAPAAKIDLHLSENQAVVERAAVVQTLTIAEAEALFKKWDGDQR